MQFTSGKKYRKLLNNAFFIRNESLFFVSAAGTSAIQLEHTPRLLRSVCPEGYRIWTIEYRKILGECSALWGERERVAVCISVS